MIYIFIIVIIFSHQKSEWFWYTREQPWWFIIVWHHSNVKHLISQDIRRATSIRYLKWTDINSFITTSCNITKQVPTTDQSSPLGLCSEWKAILTGMGNELNQNRRRDTRKAWEGLRITQFRLLSWWLAQPAWITEKEWPDHSICPSLWMARPGGAWSATILFGDQNSVSYQNSVSADGTETA